MCLRVASFRAFEDPIQPKDEHQKTGLEKDIKPEKQQRGREGIFSFIDSIWFPLLVHERKFGVYLTVDVLFCSDLVLKFLTREQLNLFLYIY